MVKQSSVNLDITPNATGFTIGGGTTERFVTIQGSQNFAEQSGSSTTTTFTFGSAASGAADTLIGSSAYSAAGTLLYGSGAGTYPSTLAAGTSGQYLQSTGTGVQWASTGTLVWTIQSGTSFNLASGAGYWTTSGSAVTVGLPNSGCPAGSVFAINVAGAGTVTIQMQGGTTGQTLRFGSLTGTIPAFASNSQGDTLFFLCTTTASTTAGAFVVIDSIGNWTIT